MDRRIALLAFIALAIIIWLGRSRILDIVTKTGGFELLPPAVETVELPPIKSPALPNFKPGPDTWTQSTGLMCACDLSDYHAPLIVTNVSVPLPPVPSYKYQANAVAPATQQLLTYSTFGFDSSFPIWGGKPYEETYMGSDGRVFLLPKGWLKDQPNETDNPLFIGTNEYRMEGGDIIYGPYRYKPRQSQFLARSA